MKKKWNRKNLFFQPRFYFLSGFILIFLISVFFYSFDKDDNDSVDYCAFCNQQVLNAQKCYEDDLVLVLCTHKPILPGHLLIIPKRHVERFEMLSEAEISQIGRLIKAVNRAIEKEFNTASYLLLQKNGKEMAQSVPHVHFHYLPRVANDFSVVALFIKSLKAYFYPPVDAIEMEKIVERMQQAIQTFEPNLEFTDYHEK